MQAKRPSILVVDDTPANLTLMTGLLQDSYQVRATISGEKALSICRSESPPDLILLDIMMPELDGHEVCRRLKADPGTRDIPVIFLTAMSEIEDEEKGLALGAVDYITKPVSPPIALARIKTHLTLYQQHKALLESQRSLAKEIQEAADYVANALPAEMQGPITARWQHIPSTSLGGDAFGYHWIDADHLAIYLLDVCGHGVGAAMLSISALNTLRSQSLTGADFRQPASVLAALNNAYLMEDHHDKFFTLWYGVYDQASHQLTYASAAHPPALMMTKNGAKAPAFHALSTPNPAIGFMQDMAFSQASIGLEPQTKIIIYSDGVYEIEKQAGGVLTLAEFTNIMQSLMQVEASQLELVLETMQGLHHNGPAFDDDFSLLEIQIHY